MKEQIIISLKVLGFAFLIILLTSMSVYLRETNEAVLYWLINTLDSMLLTFIGFKAFSKK